MHHIYHTEGIILGSKNFGEAGRYYSIFTRDLGMIHASAQGVRKMSSKLRFILQDFSYVKVDLVQGKNFWRVASASKMNRLEELVKNLGAFQVFSNIAKLLERLLAGAEQNEKLFIDLVDGLSVLATTKEAKDLENTEAILVLRILSNLGYIGSGRISERLTESPFEKNLILEAAKVRSQLVRQINQALRESHL